MATTQCPGCQSLVVGDERCLVNCSNCGTGFKMPIGFQSRVYRRCDCGQHRLSFSHREGENSIYQAPCNDKIYRFH
ncbi:MAG: hypothetical protein WCW77_00135 [Patescibacteria group bacterium]